MVVCQTALPVNTSVFRGHPLSVAILAQTFLAQVLESFWLEPGPPRLGAGAFRGPSSQWDGSALFARRPTATIDVGSKTRRAGTQEDHPRRGQRSPRAAARVASNRSSYSGCVPAACRTLLTRPLVGGATLLLAATRGKGALSPSRPTYASAVASAHAA